MQKRIVLFVGMALAVLCGYAQTTIEGTVTDSLGHATDAYITVSPKGTGSIVGFADTDSKGQYRVSFKADADSLTVTAAGLSIGQYVRVVANRSQRVDFSVRNNDIELKEVSVKAEKIRQMGDTLNYKVE